VLGGSDVELINARPRRRRISHITQIDLFELIDAIKSETSEIAGVAPDSFADFVTALFCTRKKGTVFMPVQLRRLSLEY
jgi:hypothetical protein